VRLSNLFAGRPLSPRKIPGTHFCYRMYILLLLLLLLFILRLETNHMMRGEEPAPETLRTRVSNVPGDSKLLSRFPWPEHGNPDNNLESLCISYNEKCAIRSRTRYFCHAYPHTRDSINLVPEK
jgi:hypothetical protein